MKILLRAKFNTQYYCIMHQPMCASSHDVKSELRFQHCVDRVFLLLVSFVAMFGADPVDNIHAPTASR